MVDSVCEVGHRVELQVEGPLCGGYELIRELRDAPDVVEHAIDALVGAGLARREGELVLPTRAAVRFDELGV